MSKILNLITKKEIQRDEEIRNFSIKIKFMDTGKLKRLIPKFKRYTILSKFHSEIVVGIMTAAEFIAEIYTADSTKRIILGVVCGLVDGFVGILVNQLNNTGEFYQKKVDLINEELTEREKKKLRL